jgi:hypothetical protein
MSNDFRPEKARSNAAPAAEANGGAKLVMCHAASPAGMREPFAELTEIGVQDGEVRKAARRMQEGSTLAMPLPHQGAI